MICDRNASRFLSRRSMRSGLRFLGCVALLAAVLIGNEVRLAYPGGQAKAEVYLRAIKAVKAARTEVVLASR